MKRGARDCEFGRVLHASRRERRIVKVMVDIRGVHASGNPGPVVRPPTLVRTPHPHIALGALMHLKLTLERTMPLTTDPLRNSA